MILNYVRHKSVRRPWIERYTEDGERVEADFDKKSGSVGEYRAENTGEFDEKKSVESGMKNPAFGAHTASDTTEF